VCVFVNVASNIQPTPRQAAILMNRFILENDYEKVLSLFQVLRQWNIGTNRSQAALLLEVSLLLDLQNIYVYDSMLSYLLCIIARPL
jgi:hypothetical protein